MFNLNSNRFPQLVGCALLGFGFAACRGVVVVNPGAPCRIVDQEVCHWYRDFDGQMHQECSIEHHQVCDRTMSSLGFEVSPVALADKYDISVDAAARVTDTVVNVQRGSFESAKVLGLQDADLALMSDAKMPTDAGLARMSKELDIHPDDAHALFSAILLKGN